MVGRGMASDHAPGSEISKDFSRSESGMVPNDRPALDGDGFDGAAGRFFALAAMTPCGPAQESHGRHGRPSQTSPKNGTQLRIDIGIGLTETGWDWAV